MKAFATFIILTTLSLNIMAQISDSQIPFLNVTFEPGCRNNWHTHHATKGGGQMKTLIDRMNALYSLDYKFRDVYMLTTAAEDEPEVPKRAEAGLTGWIDCYPKSHLAGTLFCGGVDAPRTIEGNQKLQEAYELGKSV